ncbi:MAG: phenylacetate--CoA ligase family protein [Xanthobacteraceae bacterium]
MDELFDRYLRTIGQTQWLPYPKLITYQQTLIEAIVRHAYEQAPFYRERLACLFTADGQFDLSNWRRVPVVTREIALAHASDMRVQALDEKYGPTSEFRTSGSGGTPFKFTVNLLARIAYNAALTRLAQWVGADTSRPLAQIRAYRDAEAAKYPDGLSTKCWSRAHMETETFGLDIRTPADLQIEWLKRKGCPYLLTSPSNALAIAYAAEPAQLRALGLEIIFCIGETVTPGTRELIAERTGTRLVGIYSSEEVGFIATECPMAQHYHIVTENTFVEIVDENDRPVASGERGRVLVTGLYNYATPFIRYDMGDAAIPDETPCTCGRTLPVISQVIGRTRNAFIFRDGKRTWPRSWDARAMRAMVPCREFQIVQVDYEKIEFHYVPDGDGGMPDVTGLTAYAREHMHPSVTVTAVAMASIPLAPGGKHEPFISKLERA